MKMTQEFKAPRPLDQIQQEYIQLCTKAGDLQYKISRFDNDLESINEQLQMLNFEAAAAREAEHNAAVEKAEKAEAVRVSGPETKEGESCVEKSAS
jgi:DNA anti-recombination protein RmuC